MMTKEADIDFKKEARDLRDAISENAYPAADGGADIDNHSLPITEGRTTGETRALPDAGLVEREAIAIEIWHRFANSTIEQWEDESHQAEYLLCADAILALLSTRAVAETNTVPFNPCLAKLREGEPFFVLLGRDKQAPAAVQCWARDRAAAEGESEWTRQALDVAASMASYSGAPPAPAGRDPATVEACAKVADNTPLNSHDPSECKADIVSAIRALAAPALATASIAVPVRIEHDGFNGNIIGSYVTREGKRGVVLQQIGTRVVHVYGEKWLSP